MEVPARGCVWHFVDTKTHTVPLTRIWAGPDRGKGPVLGSGTQGQPTVRVNRGRGGRCRESPLGGVSKETYCKSKETYCTVKRDQRTWESPLGGGVDVYSLVSRQTHHTPHTHARTHTLTHTHTHTLAGGVVVRSLILKTNHRHRLMFCTTELRLHREPEVRTWVRQSLGFGLV